MEKRVLSVIITALVIVGVSAYSYASMCHGSASGDDRSVQAAIINNTCPVTGETVSDSTGVTYEYKGKMYGFCCPECIGKFKKNPEKYTASPEKRGHQH